MCSSPYNPQDPGAKGERLPEEGALDSSTGKPAGRGPAPDEPVPDPALLESVLRETLETPVGDSSDDPLADGDMEALKEVARRHRGRPFSLEPVAVDLVEAMLHQQFPVRPESVDKWRAIAAQVAQTLCDDPHSYDRLRNLWKHLSGV